MKSGPKKLATIVATVAITSLLAACGGGGGSASSTSGASTSGASTTGAPTTGTSTTGTSTTGPSAQAAVQVPTLTNTITSGVFTGWNQGNIISSTVSLPGVSAQLVYVDGGAGAPFWTGSNMIMQGQFTQYSPGSPIYNAEQNTVPYLMSPDGINWTAQYTTIPNPLGAGYNMQVLNMASDGNGTIVAFGLDSATVGAVQGQLFVAFADAATMTWQVTLLGVQQSVTPAGLPGQDYGIAYAYGRWYVGYQPVANPSFSYLESTNGGSSWQASGVTNLLFLTNFKGDNLYRTARTVSSDLTTWTPYQASANSNYSYFNNRNAIVNSKAIVFSPVGKEPLSGGSITGGLTLTSLDGKTWLEGQINGSATAAFTCNDRLFMYDGMVGAADPAFLSDDGINWTQTTLPPLATGESFIPVAGACLPSAERAILVTEGLNGRFFYSNF